jgi:hypothetical protein
MLVSIQHLLLTSVIVPFGGDDCGGLVIYYYRVTAGRSTASGPGLPTAVLTGDNAKESMPIRPTLLS